MTRRVAVVAIGTRRKISPDVFKALSKAMLKEGKRVKAEYEKTTATWKDKPKFTVTQVSDTKVVVGTDDKKYIWIDKGTGLDGPKHRPYLIPKLTNLTAHRLVFYVPNTPKTQPNVIGSGAGAKGGTKVVRTQVLHPGITARNFTKIIQAESRLQFKVTVQDILDAWAKEENNAKG